MKKIFVCYFLISLCVISYFAFKFQYDKNIVPGHLIFSSLIHLTFLLLSYFVLGKYLRKRIFFTLYFSIYFSLWILFYALIFISNAEWGDTISLKMVAYYAKDLPSLLHTLPYSQALYIGIFLTQIVGTVTLHYFLYPNKKINLKSALKSQQDRFGKLRLSSKILVLSVFCLLAIGMYPLLMSAKRFYHLRGEPLFKFAAGYMWGQEYEQLYDPANISLDKLDDQQRILFKTDTVTGNKKNVIIILVDALRADNLSAYGYSRKTMPFIDSLIYNGKAIKIENAYSTTNCTVGGLSTMFLSKIWKHVSVNGFGLVEALKLKNYRTYGILAGYQKYWYSLASTYQKHMDFLKDGTDSKKYSIDDDRTVMENVSKLPIDDLKPTFFYFHLMSIHNLGFVQEQFHKYLPEKITGFVINEQNKDAFVNNYDNRILQANSIIRFIINTLKTKGYLKNSVVIITSDHGQSLGEGGRDGHIRYLQREAIRIPLIIIDDDLSLYKNTRLARQIDIAPTILRRLQLPIPATWEGHPLLDELKDGISFHENATWRLNRLYGFIQNDTTGIYRYMFNKDFTIQTLCKVNGNNETDVSKSDSGRLFRLKAYAQSVFRSKFTQ